MSPREQSAREGKAQRGSLSHGGPRGGSPGRHKAAAAANAFDGSDVAECGEVPLWVKSGGKAAELAEAGAELEVPFSVDLRTVLVGDADDARRRLGHEKEGRARPGPPQRL